MLAVDGSSGGRASLRAFGCLALMVLIGSSTATAAKFAVRELPVGLIPIVRFGVAGLCLWPIVGRGGMLGRMLRQDGWRLAIAAALCVPINQALFLNGARLAPTAHIGLIYAACPLIVLILAAMLGQERLTSKRVVGVAASVAGVSLIAMENLWRADPAGRDVLRGDLLEVGAVIAWGAYLTVNKPLVARHGAIPTLAATFLVGTVLDLPIAAATMPGWPPLADVSVLAWVGLAWLAIVVSVCGLAFQNLAMRDLDASQVATFGNVAPLLTVVWGYLLFDERISIVAGVGGLLVLIGIGWGEPAGEEAEGRGADEAGDGRGSVVSGTIGRAPSHPKGHRPMPVLDREEYIEQAYFFHAFRERVLDGMPAQDVLSRVAEEILSTTKLPFAIAFLATEIKVSGLMGPAMARIGHYFTPFQAHVVGQAELDVSRFAMDQALLILEREAKYKADGPTSAGLFVYQFETLSRNRLGYGKGLEAIADDPSYSDEWRDYILQLRARLGDVDFADLIFIRSSYHVTDRRRTHPDYQPKFPTLFGEKEGKIARANRGRDPLYLFSALQRQLGYPEVPRPQAARRGRGPDRPLGTTGDSAREPDQGDRRGDRPRRRPRPVHRQARGHRRTSRRVGLDDLTLSRPRACCHPRHDRDARPVKFERIVIDADFPGGYQVELADVNGDGKPDIVGVGGSTCAWYENPRWTKRVISGANQTPDIISSATLDIDGDGKAEVAIAFDFAMDQPRRGKLLLASQASDTTWTYRAIADLGSIHRLRWADVDGDKTPELVVAPIFGTLATPPRYDQAPSKIVAYRTGINPKTDPWTIEDVGGDFVSHAIKTIDLDGDGRIEILSAGNSGVTLFGLDSGKWTGRNLTPGMPGIAPKRGSSEVQVGKFADGSRFLATVEPWHGAEVAIYREDPQGKFGPRTVIDASMVDGHALWVADVDGDGDDEVFSGFRGNGASVLMFDRVGENWIKTVVDPAIAAQDLRGGDLDGDGVPDIVAIGGRTHNLVWYRPIHDVSKKPGQAAGR